MERVEGTTPTGNRARELDVWLDDQNGPPQLHLWIHAPGAGPDDGWEIRVAPENLVQALQQLGIA